MSEQTDNLPSPLKTTPDCWHNDRRMVHLFAPFRDREFNPVDYDSKMKFWKDAIQSWCFDHDQPYFSMSGLALEFKRKNRTPLCLSTVVDDLEKCGVVKEKEKYQNSDPDASWTSWAVRSLVVTPAVWSFNKMKEALVEIDRNEVEYVHMKYLKSRGDAILEKGAKEKVSLMTQAQFEEWSGLSTESADLVIHHLRTEKKCAVTTICDKKMIKIGSNQIHEGELTLARLKESQIHITKQLEQLELEKAEAVEQARQYLRKNMRAMAKKCLRRKKAIEISFEKQTNSLETVEGLLSQIQGARTDGEAYRLGIASLKSTYASLGLSEDAVADTMSELEELNEIHDEIETALSTDLRPGNEAELEEELASILATNETEDINLKLPDVPTTPLPEEKRKLPAHAEP